MFHHTSQHASANIIRQTGKRLRIGLECPCGTKVARNGSDSGDHWRAQVGVSTHYLIELVKGMKEVLTVFTAARLSCKPTAPKPSESRRQAFPDGESPGPGGAAALLSAMKSNRISIRSRPRSRYRLLTTGLLALIVCPVHAHASMFQGETLDKVANVLAWVVLVVAPAIGIAIFWLVHILPEKIAEKKQHPQAKAIQCLCLLSLVFGGLLWPLAWLWAYSKPVLYKMAYGTDKVPHGHEEESQLPVGKEAEEELKQLRQRVAELEGKLTRKAAAEGGKA
jgi:hypothetical protein